MKKLLLTIAAAILLCSSGWAQSAPDANLSISYDASSDHFELKWWAASGWYYFLQQTTDLRGEWVYFPYAVISSDKTVGIGLDRPANEPQMFFRVKYTNDPASSLLTSDFDFDNVPNKFELDNGFNPFGISDDNTNGLPDEWELLWASEFAAYPKPVRAALAFRDTTTDYIYLSNPLTFDATFTVSVQNNEAPGQYSYTFEDSLTGTVVYNWTDISTTGLLLEGISEHDNAFVEVVLKDISADFAFPFYGTEYTRIFVSSNGLITLDASSTDSSNDPMLLGPPKLGPS